MRLHKLMAKRAIEWLQVHKADALNASCEDRPGEHVESSVSYAQKVAERAATDALAYLHASASAALYAGEPGVILDLHRADQRLSGVDSRGTGIVMCEAGQELFHRALTETLARLAGIRAGGIQYKKDFV